MYRVQHPNLDWERVMRGVLAEEERIANEEAVQKLQLQLQQHKMK